MDTEVRLQIDTREPFAGGMAFGAVGPYERLVGRVHFCVDPRAQENADVVDLERAPRNDSGLVEYSAEFYILKPEDSAKGSRRLIYDVVNRGNKRLLQYFNDALQVNEPFSVADAGNGFLMRRGHTILWTGWQGDLLPGEGRMTMELPVAREDGKDITGVVRMEFVADEPGIVSIPLSGNDHTTSYESVFLDTSKSTFTVREYPYDQRMPIPPDEWRFAKLIHGGETVPSSTDCYLPQGFRPGWIYELVYTAKNPTVLGLGFISVRDLVSYLLRAEVDAGGTPNPLNERGTDLKKAYAWGVSQSGRFLREFVYRGFNRDSGGRRVFDGVWPHVAGGGRVFLNYRFAQPGRYPRQHADHTYPSDQFPFAYAVSTDALTGITDGILKRPDTDPLVIHTQSSSEYWVRRGSLVHTDSRGTDMENPETVRVYLYSSAQHSNQPNEGPQEGPHQHPTNPLNITPLHRALLDALDDWASDGNPPTHSRVPSRAGETLVPTETAKAGFPRIPGAECPAEASRVFVQDHGPDFDTGILSKEPPGEDLDRQYTVLVPQVDGDGNEIPGIRTPDVEVPLATFTGWNFRHKGSAEKALFDVKGSHFPFARTAEEREASGDARRAIQERYPSRARYVRAVAAAAQRLMEQRLLLEEDVDRYVELAMSERALD